MKIEKPKLQVGSTYNVAKDKKIFEATYLGYSEPNKTHVFEARQSGREAFLLLNDHLICEKDGAITHPPSYSFSIGFISRKFLEETPREIKSNLVKILRRAGADL